MKTETKEKVIKWAKKLGFWGFIFFLVKGLIWLAVIYFAARQV